MEVRVIHRLIHSLGKLTRSVDNFPDVDTDVTGVPPKRALVTPVIPRETHA
jgi:hypothetical protein